VRLDLVLNGGGHGFLDWVNGEIDCRFLVMRDGAV
jgi:hypothetical protein